MILELDSAFRAVGLAQSDLDGVVAAMSDHDSGALGLAAFRDLAPLGIYPARELVRHPDWLIDIALGAERARDVAAMTSGINTLLAADRRAGDDALAHLYRALRYTKRRESLRIFLREVRGVSMRETTAEFADLAEACLRASVREVAALRFAGFDELFAVLGMGKLGGRELNPGSDVDLVFVCDDRAMVEDELRGELAEFARAVVDAMAAQTRDGYVFRVDLRLRPDGSQGPIVLPCEATVQYYLQYGRTWERSAMMKARPIAGSDELGAAVSEGIEPFVYRRSLDFGAIEEIRAMKAKIEANASLDAVHGRPDEPSDAAPDPAQAPLGDRLKSRLRGGSRARPRVAPVAPVAPQPDQDAAGVLGWDVKIGVGGIREIEFFVQALQLVHSGAQPQLRVRNTLEALDALLWAGLITDVDHSSLTDAYDFLRRLEHRVQMGEDRQTHRLPTTWEGFDALATQLGQSRAAFQVSIGARRETVRGIFDRLFAVEERRASGPTLEGDQHELLDLVVRAGGPHLHSEGTRAALEKLGFGRPRQVAGQLEVLRSKAWGPFREAAWGADLALARQLVGAAAAAPDPDQAFSLLTRFAQAVGDRPGYWTMLSDNPHATRLLLQVFGSSSYFGSALIADPNVFERLLFVGAVAVEKSEQRMRDELAARLDGVSDPEHRLGVIRRFHREETLRVGLHETGGAARVDQTLEQLSILAEVVIGQVLDEVYEPLRVRRRRPGSVLPPLDEVGFSVVAMGKLGGRELGFGSDLDVVFVYEEVRQWKLEHTFYARLAQRLIRTLTTTGVDGKLYEVDTRLRPSGNRGALVVSADAFREYYEAGAGLWERQALIRARPICGPIALRERVATTRREVAFGSALGPDGLAEVARMRVRMTEALHVPGTRDVKYGPGGIVDVEFAVQAAQLSATVQYEIGEPSALLQGIGSQSTRRALDALTGSPALGRDYLWLCRLLARLRMAGSAGSSVIPDDPTALRTLARRMAHQGHGAAEAFLDEFDAVTARTRSYFDGVLGGR